MTYVYLYLALAHTLNTRARQRRRHRLALPGLHGPLEHSTLCPALEPWAGISHSALSLARIDVLTTRIDVNSRTRRIVGCTIKLAARHEYRHAALLDRRLEAERAPAGHRAAFLVRRGRVAASSDGAVPAVGRVRRARPCGGDWVGARRVARRR